MNLITPTDDDALTALGTFLQSCLPAGTATFVGQISGGTLIVSGLAGSISIGDQVLGQGVRPNTTVVSVGAADMYGVVPAQTALQTAMSTGVEIVQAQDNRVPEPRSADFVVMTMVRIERLATNVDSAADCAFDGSIAGTVMTAATPRLGRIVEGATVTGLGVADGTRVLQQTSGAPGLGGAYVVAPSQSVAARALAAGAKEVAQEAILEVQLDVHGPNSANFCQVVTTLVRDEVASDRFAAINPAVAPLYADDPRQMPFINAEQQYESRWIVTVALQVSQVVRVAQGYADAVTVNLVDVDAIPA